MVGALRRLATDAVVMNASVTQVIALGCVTIAFTAGTRMGRSAGTPMEVTEKPPLWKGLLARASQTPIACASPCRDDLSACVHRRPHGANDHRPDEDPERHRGDRNERSA